MPLLTRPQRYCDPASLAHLANVHSLFPRSNKIMENLSIGPQDSNMDCKKECVYVVPSLCIASNELISLS